MKIIKQEQIPITAMSGEYHIVTVADTGETTRLNLYGKTFGLSESILDAFVKQANKTDDSGSLHPRVPISVIPKSYFRRLRDRDELAQQLVDFLGANQEMIKAKKILLDFRPDIQPFVLEACDDALETTYAEGLTEVVIIDKN